MIFAANLNRINFAGKEKMLAFSMPEIESPSLLLGKQVKLEISNML
ncbi:MAG: hypothetical protein KBF99_16405 [Leptospiraceae bacterium]|nr:hypothetical protein [Leptospiraceae bacterium]